MQGPISDKGRESFTNYGQIPIRHGMTIGELARFYNSERGIHARLTVVPMEGWQRGDWLDSTGVLWVNPSPNMRSLTEAALYPGVGHAGGDQCFGGTRHGYSLRSAGRAVDSCRWSWPHI